MSAVLESRGTSQPISGVSANRETEITTAYPSVAATMMGQRIGRFCDWLPLRTNGVSWSRLLIVAPLWILVVPISVTIALLLYGYQKVFGRKYVLTNRSLQVRQMVGIRSFASVPLTDIKRLDLEELPGQGYYKAADVVARGGDGKVLVRLDAVPRAAVFRQTILEARDARLQVEESLKTIQARKQG